LEPTDQLIVSVMDIINASEFKNIVSITSHIQTDYHKICQVICQYLKDHDSVSYDDGKVKYFLEQEES